MTRLATLFLLASIVMIFISCTPAKVKYLRERVNQVTQDDITKEFGPPHFSRTLDDGTIVWTYQYTSVAVGPTGGGSSCREYILIFDRDKILREWKRQRCNK